MDNIITFGKYNGQSFEQVFKSDKNYCSYVLSVSNPNDSFKKFQEYLMGCSFDIKYKNITCSDLSKIMVFDKNIRDLIKDININETDVKTIQNTNNISKSLFGQFIDYLIRYKISKNKKIKFQDNRSKYILSKPQSYQELCMILLMNDKICYNEIDIVSNFDEELLQDINTKLVLEKYKSLPEYPCIKSYIKMCNGDRDVYLPDILNASICHSLFFGNMNDLKYINYNEDIIDDESYKNISKYITKKTKDSKNILLNPSLGNMKDFGIVADCDLIIDNELIDFKMSTSTGTNINDYIQLIIYACLYYFSTKIICNKLTIYNPIIGKENYIEIDVNIIISFTETLKSYKK